MVLDWAFYYLPPTMYENEDLEHGEDDNDEPLILVDLESKQIKFDDEINIVNDTGIVSESIDIFKKRPVGNNQRTRG